MPRQAAGSRTAATGKPPAGRPAKPQPAAKAAPAAAAKTPRRKTTAAAAPAAVSMSAVAAVKRDLEEIRRNDARVAESGLAASALALAREIDSRKNSATSKSMCARELREVLDRLRELAPPVEAGDRLDDLSARRSARRSAA